MKLIKKEQLFFKDQKSDKVYEVDLCEMGVEQYVVNFRYGKRGGVLKDGTKTSTAVSKSQAEKIFTDLVASKTKKGYQSSNAPSPSVSSIPSSNIEFNRTAVSAILIGHLRKAVLPAENTQVETETPTDKSTSFLGKLKNIISKPTQTPDTKPVTLKKKSERPIARILWRMGELRLTEALPLILRVEQGSETTDTYSLVWALGRCGDITALPKLEQILADNRTTSEVKWLIRAAKMQLLAEADKELFAGEIFNKFLPEQIQSSLRTNDVEQIVAAVNEQIAIEKNAYQATAALYLLSEGIPIVRTALIKWFERAPFKGGYFNSIRHLYKVALFKDDAELFGLADYRITKEKPGFNTPLWGDTIYRTDDNGRWESVNYKKEVKKPNSKLGFSSKTKAYLKRRTWRHLRRMGESGDTTYVNMAVGILLNVTDQDKVASRKEVFSRYENRADGSWRRITKTIHYSEFPDLWSIGHILYGNSHHYTTNSGKTKWIYKEGFTAANKNEDNRQEAFPNLWNALPQGSMHLLAASQCEDVQLFAVKVAKDNLKTILPLVDVDFILQLLSKKYAVTNQFGLDLARKVYKPTQIDFDLVLGLLNCDLPEARNQALKWIGDQKQIFLTKENFLSKAVFTPHKEVSVGLGKLLKGHTFNKNEGIAILSSATAKMLNATETATEKERLEILHAGALLTQQFTEYFNEIDLATVDKLLNHPLDEVKVYGAKILVVGDWDSKQIPETLIESLLNGELSEMRAVGVQLLGNMSDEQLLERRMLLRNLVMSPHSEIRQTVQPIIGRLAKGNASFGAELTQDIALCLLKKEAYEGLDEDLKVLLTEQLKDHLSQIELRRVLQLIHSPRKAANEMGLQLLVNHWQSKDLKMRQIVRLASHELIAIRNWVWDFYNEEIARVKFEIEESIRIVDAKWNDSRDFAFDYFRKNMTEDEWTPEVLISICDSVNPMVQQYGQELITHYFKEESGEQYLLQLSQHPTAELQRFATNYLERFASDNPENIKQLELYFITVLSGINKSSVAKERIYDFLRTEGLKDQKTAKVVASVLARQSAMMTIRDKAKCIAIMRDLNGVYGDLEMPIKVKPIAVYPIN